MHNQLSIRPIESTDVELITDYWLTSSSDFLIGMGVDLKRLPKWEDLITMLLSQIKSPITQKQSYALIWLLNNKAIGHCNVNQLRYGESAYMHLHLWDPN